jgi:hypothetical protein
MKALWQVLSIEGCFLLESKHLLSDCWQVEEKHEEQTQEVSVNWITKNCRKELPSICDLELFSTAHHMHRFCTVESTNHKSKLLKSDCICTEQSRLFTPNNVVQ